MGVKLKKSWKEGVTLMRRGRQLGNGAQNDGGALANEPKPAELGNIPFAQRLTCTVAEACEVTGLGRAKLYELIGDGRVTTTTIGRRRLVLVQSLLALVGAAGRPLAAPSSWRSRRP